MRPFASLRASARSPLLQVVKTSVAAIVAWLLSVLLLQQPLPIFAAIAALLVVQPSVTQSLAKGVERSLGVVLGVLLAYGAGALFGHASWVVLGAIVAALLLAWALRLTPGSSNQIPISAMLVLAIGAQTPAYAVDRILETIIGAVVGLAVNAAIVPPVLVAPARREVARLAASVAKSLERLGETLTGSPLGPELDELLAEARALRPLQAKAASSLDQAEESLALNPRGGRHRASIEQDRALLARLSILVTRVVGMTRAVHDNYDASLQTDAMVVGIAAELRRAAHDLRLMAREVGAAAAVGRPAVEPPSVNDDLPALTAPLVIAAPDPDNWVLVGSLLEDLRRVREEIMGASDV